MRLRESGECLLAMLAQVGALLPMLKRGIGVHHSGLLPILKEVIEIMFQENLIKVLPLVNPHSLPHKSHANTTQGSAPCSEQLW